MNTMQYSNMSDSESDDEYFRDESLGRGEGEMAARPRKKSHRKSSSNPTSFEDDEARKSRKKSKRKSSKRHMTEEEISARNARRSAKMEAEAAGLEVPPGSPSTGRMSSREVGGEPRSSGRRSTRSGGSMLEAEDAGLEVPPGAPSAGRMSSREAQGEPRSSGRRSTRSSGSMPRQETKPGAQSMPGSRGIDEAVKVGDFDGDEEDPFQRRSARDGRPAPKPSASAKQNQEINKDFKDVRETGRWGSISKKEMWIVGIVGLLVIIGVVVGVVVGTSGNNAPPPPAPVAPPPPVPTAAPTARVVLTAQQQLDAIRGATIDNPTTQNSLQLLPEDVSFYEGKANDPTAAPVVRAASWIMYDDPIDNEDWLLVRYALAVLYYATNGDAWTTKDGWLTDASACEWHGMRCDRFNKGVEEIDLSGNNLSGPIPDEVNMVSGLISLWLRKNTLTGTVPNVALGAIPLLSILYLDGNSLTGEITPDLAASGSLKTLFIQGNGLGGVLPYEFCPQRGVGGLLEFGIDCDVMECFCCTPDNCF